ncbi:hypothetical protein BB561_005970 [Smittium simulii]|uniref:HMG box domain-containing protein n=1 Tax=Smittium simulii TaxID=133385 RepID=A0A2T9Y7A1_9FUNG|nr:hypothetical protein BB561_005970 [Smittium simulii]
MSKANRMSGLKRGRYANIEPNQLKIDQFQIKPAYADSHLISNIIDPRVLTVKKAVAPSRNLMVTDFKEKTKVEKTKEKEVKAKQREKEKELRAKEKEKEAKLKLKEKERVAKAKEKEKAAKAKAKQKEKEKKLKAKELEKLRPIIAPPKFPYFSGYTLFCAESYRNLKEVLSSPTLEQVNNQTKANAKMWHAMNEANKLAFEEKAALINKERTREIGNWWETADRSLVALENQRRRKINATRKREGKRRMPLLIDPRLPKKPPSKFMMFVKDLSLTNKKEMSESITEFSKNASLKWKELPESQKEAYRQRYEMAYKEYLQKVKLIENSSSISHFISAN